MKRRPPRRLSRRAGDTPYRRFVNSLPCCSCGRPSPSEASHVTLSADQKGVGMKVSDAQVVPHCRACHRAWEQRRGRFEGWSRQERWDQAARWVAAVQLLATPEGREQALDFQDLGLGWIELTGETGWAWHPGPRPADKPSITRNEPSPEGSEAGAALAKMCDEAEARLRAVVGPTPERCGGCAARAGTYANACGSTLVAFTEALVNGEPFFCHAGLGLEREPNPEPKLICRGWIAMARPEDLERVTELLVRAGEAV